MCIYRVKDKSKNFTFYMLLKLDFKILILNRNRVRVTKIGTCSSKIKGSSSGLNILKSKASATGEPLTRFSKFKIYFKSIQLLRGQRLMNPQGF